MPEDQEYDLDALADSLLANFNQPSAEPEVPPVVSGGGDTPSPEVTLSDPPAPVTPAPPSPEDLERYYQARLSRDAQAMSADRATQELMEKITKAETDDETAIELGRRLAAEVRATQFRSEVTSQAEEATMAAQLQIILPDEFVSSLSPEEKARIDPAKFSDDAAWLKEVEELRVDRRLQSRDEEEFTKRVEEAATAKVNQQRGQQLRGSSPTAVPAARPGEDNTRKSGRDMMEDAFAELRSTYV